MVSAVVATFAVLAIPNSKYCGSSGLDWGGIALGCSSASEGELEGAQGGDTADSRGAEICVCHQLALQPPGEPPVCASHAWDATC